MSKVLTFGVFDYFHLGHLKLFKNCKNYGDYLIVAVQDGDYILKYKPEATVMYSTEQRVEMVESLRVVDEVVVYQGVCPEFLETVNFDILALGEDHTAERWVRATEWCENHGKMVVRMKRTPEISSSQIKHDLLGKQEDPHGS